MFQKKRENSPFLSGQPQIPARRATAHHHRRRRRRRPPQILKSDGAIWRTVGRC
ncbi:hypothetical protein V6Z11_A03G218300 [Gossypium hirsutum]